MALSPDQLKKYWEAANKLRKNMDAAEYKHIVLGLVFLKYVSDAFEERQAELRMLFEDSTSDKFKKDPVRREAALNERDNYTEVNVFWVPEKARWSLIQQNSKQSDIAVIIDNALYEVEKENKVLLGFCASEVMGKLYGNCNQFAQVL